jgi:hypothetical protein
MTPTEFAANVYTPALAKVRPFFPARISWTPAAHQMLMTIAGQESGWKHRRQLHNGPARGFWQFEAGGVRGVMRHPVSAGPALALCGNLGVPFVADDIHEAIETNDALAVGFARLLLFTDRSPLPSDAAAGWDYYLRNWRPGKPHTATWFVRWTMAQRALREGKRE